MRKDGTGYQGLYKIAWKKKKEIAWKLSCREKALSDQIGVMKGRKKRSGLIGKHRDDRA